MRGRTCLVTGANSGIGRETVAGLAERGARVLMVCRHRGRAEAAIEYVRRSVPGADLDLVLADLSRLRSVRALVGEVERRTDRLDVLVSNAGLLNVRRRETEDAFETTFAVNHLAPLAANALHPGVVATKLLLRGIVPGWLARDEVVAARLWSISEELTDDRH